MPTTEDIVDEVVDQALDLVPTIDELLAMLPDLPIDVMAIVDKVVAIISQAVAAINVVEGAIDNLELIKSMSIPAIVVMITELVEWVLSVLPT